MSRFELLEVVGEGGTGEVWRAYDVDTGAIVAVKKYWPHLSRAKDLKRFLRESENLAAIRHRNVLRWIGPGEWPNSIGYAMEYCPKGDLYRWAAVERSLDDRLALFSEICKGVAAVHDVCLHRDIKPGNILIGEDGRAKIADFGLSLALEETTRVTTSNWFTLAFAAPEQLFDMRGVDTTADYYSLGVVLYWLLTGMDRSRPLDLRAETIPQVLRPLLAWMLESDPERRCRGLSPVVSFVGKARVYPEQPTDSSPDCGGPGWIMVGTSSRKMRQHASGAGRCRIDRMTGTHLRERPSALQPHFLDMLATNEGH